MIASMWQSKYMSPLYYYMAKYLYKSSYIFIHNSNSEIPTFEVWLNQPASFSCLICLFKDNPWYDLPRQAALWEVLPFSCYQMTELGNSKWEDWNIKYY